MLGSVVPFPFMYEELCLMSGFVQDFSFWYGNFCYTMVILHLGFFFLLGCLKQQAVLRHAMFDSGKSFFFDLCWTPGA